jgi:hypothetical protein
VRHLISKLIAGGLSAAVILLWWPSVFPSDAVESWLVRGIVWTLSFELMLHAFMPVEESLWRTHAARRVRDQAVAASARLAADSPRRRSGGRNVVAVLALLVPVALLASAPPQPPKAQAHETVRHVTEVKRVVKVVRRRVEVRVPAPTAAGATVLDSQSPVPARGPAGRRQTPRRAPDQGTTRTGDRPTAVKPPRSTDPPVATSPQPAAPATDGGASPGSTSHTVSVP